MSTFERLFSAVLMALAIFAGVIFAAITITVPIDAIGRYLFASSIVGLTDLVENGLMAAVLLAAPWILYKGEHVAVDLFAAALGDTARRILHTATCLLGIVISLVMTWYGIETMLRAMNSGTMVRRILTFPQSWTFVPLIICFALIAIEFARQLFAGPKTIKTMSH
tara:strand:- start:291 stop:788 length:498 start_codon:yes stop_codon:yes gene_type:complete